MMRLMSFCTQPMVAVERFGLQHARQGGERLRHLRPGFPQAELENDSALQKRGFMDDATPVQHDHPRAGVLDFAQLMGGKNDRAVPR